MVKGHRDRPWASLTWRVTKEGGSTTVLKLSYPAFRHSKSTVCQTFDQRCVSQQSSHVLQLKVAAAIVKNNMSGLTHPDVGHFEANLLNGCKTEGAVRHTQTNPL